MLQDARFAFRQLLKTPAFTLIAIVTLALAIGANTAIFSAADAVLLHPLPYPDPDRLVILQENLPVHNLKDIPPSPEDFAAFRGAKSFSQIAAMISGDANLAEGAPEDVDDARVTASLFPMLGIVPSLGSLFNADQEQPGKDHVAIFSESLWIRRYGADRAVIGKNIQINRESYRVIGVVRTNSVYHEKAEIWLPLSFTPAETAPNTRGPHYVQVFGRLNRGTSIEQAREEFSAIARQIYEQYPNQTSLDRNFSIDVWPMAEKQEGDLRMPLLVLLAAVGALMLIACANVSNLLLARGVARRKEISIRAALGAARGRVVRLLLTESLTLALMAGLLGIVLAHYVLRLTALCGPADLIRGTQPSLNVWVIVFSIGLSVAASALFGFAPALAVSRVDLAESLKEGSRGSTASRRVLRESMVAFEIAVSLILLIGSGLLARSFVTLAHENPGFDAENVLNATVALPRTQYRTAAQRTAFARALLERALAIPGVRSAAVADVNPYRGGAGSAIKIPDNPDAPGAVVWETRTSPDLFRTMGIPVLRGRDFLPMDEQRSTGAAILDENVARNFFPNQDPIGRRVTLPIAGGTFPVVGIVGAIKDRNLVEAPPLRIYYLGPQMPMPVVTVILKTAGDPLRLIAATRREILALDLDMPVTPHSMEQILAESLTRERFAIWLMSTFATISALLAAIGIYGVLAYVADQRRNEFGIRMALGARPLDVLALVIRQGSIPVMAGVLFGIAGALVLTRLLGALLYGVSPTDPLIFATVALGISFASFLAMMIPARRATRIDPAEALRRE